jgi:lipoate-protein ligase A
MTCWRWLDQTQPGSPEFNMALDAALLEALRDGAATMPIIRIYQWDRPSVSFGRLQSEVAVENYYPALPRIRRPTGGRAVLHGEDITVSVAMLTTHLPAHCKSGVLGAYRQILAGVIQGLGGVGICAQFGSSEPGHAPKKGVNCFDMADGCDLIDTRTGRKILGSAQRREGEAILQQMSLPLAIIPNLVEFKDVLKSAFQEALEIGAWQTIDTSRWVRYTENEESEECPWRVKS